MKLGFYQLCEIRQNAETMVLNQFLTVMWDSAKYRDNGIEPASTSYVRFTKMQRQWYETSFTVHLCFCIFKLIDKYCSYVVH